ncbi:MAG: porphobilinogen synthase [Chlamydiales bacterium]|nr:porphobilinogen synthase [Chlamydiales bacterium]
MRVRPRRNRKNPSIRELLQEVKIHPQDLIAPFFVVDGSGIKDPIRNLPLQYRYSADELIQEAIVLYELGIKAIALFPVISPFLRDNEGSESKNPKGLIPTVISFLKKELPDLAIIADVALDPYTSHGHDGVVNEFGEIDNDISLQALADQAIIQAIAGADIVAPSDMMDGRVGFIRDALDQEGFQDVNILSYTAKYASSLYRPFRDALQTRLSFGDKKTYQMNPANKREAILEAKLDQQEGADMLMVKPATLYLDIISKMKEVVDIPVGAYHVSGEYAMVMAAEEKGYLNSEDVFYETLLSIKRAGADFIFTYAAKQLLKKLDLYSEKLFETMTYQ